MAVTKTVVKVLLTFGMMNFNLRLGALAREVTSADMASSDEGEDDGDFVPAVVS